MGTPILLFLPLRAPLPRACPGGPPQVIRGSRDEDLLAVHQRDRQGDRDGEKMKSRQRQGDRQKEGQRRR